MGQNLHQVYPLLSFSADPNDLRMQKQKKQKQNSNQMRVCCFPVRSACAKQSTYVIGHDISLSIKRRKTVHTEQKATHLLICFW